MNDSENIFVLRFFDEGKNLTPSSFNAKELGQLIISFYEGLTELIDIKYPEVNASEINLSLVAIENKSESLIWKYSSQPQVVQALHEYASAVGNKTYTDLPYATYRSVKQIYGITKRKKCDAELVEKGKRLFVVSKNDSLIKQAKVLVKSDMVLYGILNKIGGDKSRAWVELFDGSRISFPITDEQLVQLRSRLKEVIAIKGKATWSAISNKVVYFKIREVIDYIPGTVAEGFSNIKALSEGWDSLNTQAAITSFLNGEV